ncbi:MAG: NAD(P)H-binding protein [Flavobacteriales bacterium]|jgi:uncharacterized protein YbjT (DUF2867 family)|nr:NAD(P)H-binding protein [Flavobacteriales bacterium]MCB0757830.1 NAD(P)H-binding protein [Flavobacteriales bacterium]
MSKTILLAGATGLVGSACLPLLLADERVGKVIALVRRPLTITHPKLEQWVGDDLQEELKPAKVDAVICCLGTTIKNAGSQAAFLAVDKALPLGIARWAKAQGVPTYVIISAVGADPGSRVFYSRVKGEVEQELEAMQFSNLSIFQPSVLSGPRQEKRFGEGVGIVVMHLLGPLLLGSLARLRVMPHMVLARALVEASIDPQGGMHRYTYRDIRRMTER